jgi:hypothetical protein
VLTLNGNTGDSLIFVDSRGGALNDPTHLVFISANDAARNEVRRIGKMFQVDIAPNTNAEYPVDSLVRGVIVGNDDRHLTVASVVADTTMTLDDISSLSAGDTLLVDTGLIQESKVIQSVNTGANQVRFATGLANAHAVAALATPTFSLKTLTSAAPAGSRVVATGNRISLAVGDVVRVGTAPNDEYATIVGVPNRSPAGVAPDAGNVVLDHALVLGHASGDALRRQSPPALTALQPTVLVLAASPEAATLLLSDGTGFVAGTFLSVTIPTGEIFYHAIIAATVASPVEVTLQNPLERAHPAGSVIVPRNPLIQVQALDVGAWGNRLRISVQDEAPGLVSRTTLSTIINPTHIRLTSAAGVEAGTILELLDPLNHNAVVDTPLKVVLIDRGACARQPCD